MKRSSLLEQLRSASGPWDVLVIGGGATGLGVAVDAASRGFRTLLLEQHDFAKATSSRSTKIAHGGVRYLQQGDIGLVFEALHERGLMIRNAPHLAYPLSYVVPAFHWWELPFYGIGLKIYDALAGRSSLGASRILGKKEAMEQLPTLKSEKLVGGILYMDGQFDDARLALTLALTAKDLGAVPLNYMRVDRLLKEAGDVVGAVASDVETGETFEVRARVVINATGIFTDSVRRMDEEQAESILSVSRGTHIVVDGSFLPGKSALMIPKTEDGRVLFGIPWYGHLVIGTTDVPQDSIPLEPRPTEDEVDFLIHHCNLYLDKPLKRSDVLSVFSGLRPLVRAEGTSNTSKLSRSHRIIVSHSKLLTITGGKWTTYRRMAQDAVDRAIQTGGLEEKPSRTRDLPLHAAIEVTERSPKSVYGSDFKKIQELADENPGLAGEIHPELPYNGAEVVWALRHEMARSLEDVLARRFRSLFLNAKASLEAAPRVVEIMASELGQGPEWQEQQLRSFRETAASYLSV